MNMLYLRKIVNELWEKKEKVIILVIILSIVMGGMGYYKSNIGAEESSMQELKDYENTLVEYDDVIAELETSIALTEDQVEELEEYINESVYMQLDSQQIAVAEVQYGIRTNDNVGFILSALVMYVNEGSFRSQVAELEKEVPEECLKEIINCSVNGNILHISVMAPEQKQAKTLLEAVKQSLQEQKPKIESVQGLFSIEELDSTEYVKADATVLNAQNANLNNLKNYKTNLSDLKKKLIDQKLNRKHYIEDNEPEVPEQESRVKLILKYMIFGVILGVLIPAAWFALRYIMSNTIKEKEELLAAGIPVLGSFNVKKGYDSELALTVLDIQMLAEKLKCGQVFLNNLTEDEDTRQIMESCTGELEKEKLSIVAGVDLHLDAEKLRQMIKAGGCLLIAKLGKTGYVQVEEQIQLAQKFGISIWGCILVG